MGEGGRALQVHCPAPTSAGFHHRNTLLHVFERVGRLRQERGEGTVYCQEPRKGDLPP